MYIVFIMLVLVALYGAFILFLTLLSLLFYKIISGKTAKKQQVIAVLLSVIGVWLLFGLGAVMSGADFGSVPGEPPAKTWDVIWMFVGFTSLHIIVGCCVARLTERLAK